MIEWDYSELARSYYARPGYAPDAIAAMVAASPTGRVCDIGAGTGHLTLALLDRGRQVDAVEPNAQMRAVGAARTRGRDVAWYAATGESTGRDSGAYGLVTFGSSFNVVDAVAALAETRRLLELGGTFACLWNHRDLSDPLQVRLQAEIEAEVPGYDHGSRRADQTEVIAAAGHFSDIQEFSGRIVHHVASADWLEGWRAHATLRRQSGDRFGAVMERIAEVLRSMGDEIAVPYNTRGWLARRTS